jgi:hypothetical protein
MKKIYIGLLGSLLIFFLLVCVSDCDSKPGSVKFQNKIEIKAECTPPHNPYNDPSEHYAGFKWAQENRLKCQGIYDSFIEGCEEYYKQLSEYNQCNQNIKNSH